MPKIRFILENYASCPLADSGPLEVKDTEAVSAEFQAWLDSEEHVLSAGDTIRIVEAE